MKRGYTVEDYREMLGADPRDVPDAAVTSDFIVGFCGETEEDFQPRSSWSARRGSRTASSSSTASGPAPRPPSCMPDDVPEEVKRRRNNELLAVQNAISEEDNQPFIGRQVEVLVEGPSKTSQKHRRAGRLLQLDRPHALRPDRGFRGAASGKSASCCRLPIYDANAFTLFGAVVTQHVGPEVYALSL